jgi:uncharacterized protein YfiM (DUF2279 family)
MMGRIVITSSGYWLSSPDKAKHFLAGIILGAIGMVIPTTLNLPGAELYGIAFGTAVGFGKEVADYFRPAPNDVAEVMDFGWTVAGACVIPALVRYLVA